MANRYFIAGGVDNNWDTAGNWSATDGGAASGVKPTASDDVFFTSNSPNCTVNTAGVGLTINFTGYTNTITMTAGLSISGSVTLSAAMTIAGASTLTILAAATLTSNGKTWPNSLTFTTSTVTVTLADNWDVNGTLTRTAGILTLNGNTINVAGGLNLQTSSAVSGTTNIVLDGTGTVSLAGNLGNNLTINTAGTITFSAATHALGGGTFTYTAGTVVTTGSTISSLFATTWAANGITWNNLTLGGGSTTHTLNENLNCSGLLAVGSGASTTTTINGNQINAGGGVRHRGTSGNVQGTTIINATGTGTFDGPTVTTGVLLNTLYIDAGGGTITVADTFRLGLQDVNYVSGTVITDAGTWTTGGGSAGGIRLAGHGGLAA